jgi:hypothetical protein
MSNRNNDVFQVLPVTNCTLLGAGNSVEDLAVGQLGAFDADTMLSVNQFTSPQPKNIFFAVGKLSPNEEFDIRQSAGQFIQKQGVTGYTQKDYNAGSPMVVTVGNFKAKADTEYGIRVEFRNAKINRIQGYNQFSKAYLVTTPCAADCAVGCDSLDANELTKLFIAEINNDVAGLLVAEGVARQALTIADHGTSANYAIGAVVSAEDIDAVIAFNATALDADKVFVDIQLTSQPLRIGSFCQVNLHYYKLLETVLVVSLIEGFNCSGAVTTNTYPVFAEGTGANILQKEYHASGWAGSGPYKLSEVTGTAKGNIEYLADKNTNYDQIILEYNLTSQSGWSEYSSPLSTVFAIPSGECALASNLTDFLDTFISGIPEID